VCALCLLTPRPPGQLPFSRCGWWFPSPPLTHCDNYRGVNLLRLQSQSTRLARRLPAGVFTYRPSLNDRKNDMRASSLKFSTARNTILNTEKFSQVSRVSLTSIITRSICQPESRHLLIQLAECSARSAVFRDNPCPRHATDIKDDRQRFCTF